MKVLQQRITATNQMIDISELSEGTYLYKILTNNNYFQLGIFTYNQIIA